MATMRPTRRGYTSDEEDVSNNEDDNDLSQEEFTLPNDEQDEQEQEEEEEEAARSQVGDDDIDIVFYDEDEEAALQQDGDDDGEEDPVREDDIKSLVHFLLDLVDDTNDQWPPAAYVRHMMKGCMLSDWDGPDPFTVFEAFLRELRRAFTRGSSDVYKSNGVAPGSHHPAEPEDGPVHTEERPPLPPLYGLESYQQPPDPQLHRMESVVDISRAAYAHLATDAVDWTELWAKGHGFCVPPKWVREHEAAKERIVATICQSFLQNNSDLELALPFKPSRPMCGAETTRDEVFGRGDPLRSRFGATALALRWRDGTSKALPVSVDPILGGRTAIPVYIDNNAYATDSGDIAHINK
ncbi:hypothetical protein BU23DRAFT_571609 [Bimuria novae-zelandiae CBS 107.79]|uniref:Uncharacterized protein n=1 Tax=Bimuria novae-zelandiae CBS 107.79 TaxID=1447943 RepID=A0A6A5UWN2_9PLEO|nr:hypothetical protein BU23DRAFT_571609 [Bimuria novae-zelandiae CBS 107.79]